MKFTQVLEQLTEGKQTLTQWKKACTEKGWTVEYDNDEKIWAAIKKDEKSGKTLQMSLYDTSPAQRHIRHDAKNESKTEVQKGKGGAARVFLGDRIFVRGKNGNWIETSTGGSQPGDVTPAMIAKLNKLVA